MLGVSHAFEIGLHGADKHLRIVDTSLIASDVGATLGRKLKTQMGPQGVEGDRLGHVHGRDDVLCAGAEEGLVARQR